MSDAQNAQLVAWLQDEGYSAEEIQTVLAKVTQYERKVLHEALFDGLANDEVDLGAIIREALDRP